MSPRSQVANECHQEFSPLATSPYILGPIIFGILKLGLIQFFDKDTDPCFFHLGKVSIDMLDMFQTREMLNRHASLLKIIVNKDFQVLKTILCHLNMS